MTVCCPGGALEGAVVGALGDLSSAHDGAFEGIPAAADPIPPIPPVVPMHAPVDAGSAEPALPTAKGAVPPAPVPLMTAPAASGTETVGAAAATGAPPNAVAL